MVPAAGFLTRQAAITPLYSSQARRKSPNRDLQLCRDVIIELDKSVNADDKCKQVMVDLMIEDTTKDSYSNKQSKLHSRKRRKES